MSLRLDVPAVHRRMAELHLTQNGVAERMGISPQALSVALSRGTFSHINVFRLAEALGMRYEDVYKEV